MKQIIFSAQTSVNNDSILMIAVLRIDRQLVRHPSCGDKISTSPMRIAPRFETMLKCPYYMILAWLKIIFESMCESLSIWKNDGQQPDRTIGQDTWHVPSTFACMLCKLADMQQIRAFWELCHYCAFRSIHCFEPPFLVFFFRSNFEWLNLVSLQWRQVEAKHHIRPVIWNHE